MVFEIRAGLVVGWMKGCSTDDHEFERSVAFASTD